MNRLQPRPMRDTLPLVKRSSDLATSGQFLPARHGTHTALFAPLHYEPNYAYPLLVWLHGPGDDENQLKRIMPLVSLRNYVAVAVRGPSQVHRTGGKPGYTWTRHRNLMTLADERVFDAIEMAQSRFNISPDRIFLAGFDCGGTMAFRLGMDHPHHFAGVLSLCGEFPSGARRYGGCLKRAACRFSSPAGATAAGILPGPSAIISGCSTARECKSHCDSTLAAMKSRRPCSPTWTAGSWSRSLERRGSHNSAAFESNLERAPLPDRETRHSRVPDRRPHPCCRPASRATRSHGLSAAGSSRRAGQTRRPRPMKRRGRAGSEACCPKSPGR